MPAGIIVATGVRPICRTPIRAASWTVALPPLLIADAWNSTNSVPGSRSYRCTCTPSTTGLSQALSLAARTNRDTIAAIYGPYVEDWVGKAITIYMDPKCKSPNGGTIPGIRVRPMAPRGAAETTLPERPVDEDMRAAQDEAFADEGREPGQEG